MNLYKAATITCDDITNSHECTNTETYREPIKRNTEDDFVANAKRYFELNGWRYGPCGVCYCPTHNAVAPAPV